MKICMIKYFLSFLILIIFFSCKEKKHWERRDALSEKVAVKDTSLKIQDTATVSKLGIYSLVNDSVLVPPFEVQISLSPKAKDRMVNGNEKIIVVAFLRGVVKESSKKNNEKDSSTYISSARQLISYGETAVFNNLEFTKKIYDELADKDLTLNINVFSGRVSSENNLLDVDFFSDKISHVINKNITLKGKLMYGE